MDVAGQRSFPQVLAGPRIALVAVQPEHSPRLWQIRAEPEVHRWWGVIDPAFPFDEDDDTPGFAVLLPPPAAGQETAPGRPPDAAPDAAPGNRLPSEQIIGFVQFSEENEPMYRHAGIDLFLSASVHGQGLGRETVGVVAQHLIDVRGHHRLVIDPCALNERAIACYAAVGFRPVGLMRQYERAPEGVWRDGLLMDLLATELVRPADAQR
jgi:aminoglycoside 6'-N-acetyltransferase